MRAFYIDEITEGQFIKWNSEHVPGGVVDALVVIIFSHDGDKYCVIKPMDMSGDMLVIPLYSR